MRKLTPGILAVAFFACSTPAPDDEWSPGEPGRIPDGGQAPPEGRDERPPIGERQQPLQIPPGAGNENRQGLCQADADCPATMYCRLGVCVQGCRLHDECAVDERCTAHGRCLPVALDGPERAEMEPVEADLLVEPLELALGDDRDEGVFLLRAEGAPVEFRIEVVGDAEDVVIQPDRGVVEPLEPLEVRVTIQRGVPGFHALPLQLITPHGRLDLRVVWHQGLHDTYSGLVQLTEPQEMGEYPIAVRLWEIAGDCDAGERCYGGLIDAAGSPLFTEHRALVGYRTGGRLVMRTADVVESEWFGRRVGRTIDFIVDDLEDAWSPDGRTLTGRYQERLHGLLASEGLQPIVLSGEFFLSAAPRGADIEHPGDLPEMPPPPQRGGADELLAAECGEPIYQLPGFGPRATATCLGGLECPFPPPLTAEPAEADLAVLPAEERERVETAWARWRAQWATLGGRKCAHPGGVVDLCCEFVDLDGQPARSDQACADPLQYTLDCGSEARFDGTICDAAQLGVVSALASRFEGHGVVDPATGRGFVHDCMEELGDEGLNMPGPLDRAYCVDPARIRCSAAVFSYLSGITEDSSDLRQASRLLAELPRVSLFGVNELMVRALHLSLSVAERADGLERARRALLDGIAGIMDPRLLEPAVRGGYFALRPLIHGLVLAHARWAELSVDFAELSMRLSLSGGTSVGSDVRSSLAELYIAQAHLFHLSRLAGLKGGECEAEGLPSIEDGLPGANDDDLDQPFACAVQALASLDASVDARRALMLRVLDVQAGHAFAGQALEFVPFERDRFDQSTNFEVVAARVLDLVNLAQAHACAARSLSRAHERDAQQFALEVVRTQAQFGDQLATVCGEGTDLSTFDTLTATCGQRSGALHVAVLDMAQRYIERRLILEQIENVHRRVAIEQDRLNARVEEMKSLLAIQQAIARSVRQQSRQAHDEYRRGVEEEFDRLDEVYEGSHQRREEATLKAHGELTGLEYTEAKLEAALAHEQASPADGGIAGILTSAIAGSVTGSIGGQTGSGAATKGFTAALGFDIAGAAFGAISGMIQSSAMKKRATRISNQTYDLQVLSVDRQRIAHERELDFRMADHLVQMAELGARRASRLRDIDYAQLQQDIQASAAMMQTQAEVLSQIQLELNEGEALIRGLLLNISELKLRHSTAVLEATKAEIGVFDLIESVRRTWRQKERVTQLLGRNPANDPAWRHIRDAQWLAAERSFELAQKEAHAALRAFEFEIAAEPGLSRQVLIAITPEDLTYLIDGCARNTLAHYRRDFGDRQEYSIEVSIARDVLGITGPRRDVPGRGVVSEGELFREELARGGVAPDGSMSVSFSTDLGAGVSLFDRDLCLARVISVEAQLVMIGSQGDTEARVILAAAGGSSDVTCSERVEVGYSLPPVRTLVEAGVNRYPDARSPNVGLRDRSVHNDLWVLTIPGGETAPTNADLDLRGIEDIILRIRYEGASLQAEQNDFVFVCPEVRGRTCD